MTICRKHRKLGIIGAVASATASAAVLNILFRIVFVVRGTLSESVEWAYLMSAVFLIAAVIPLFYKYLGVSKRLIFCVTLLLSTVAIHHFTISLPELYWEYCGKQLVFIPIEGLYPLFFDEWDLLFFGMLGCVVVLGLCRLYWGAEVLEPAYYCRKCSYDLTGCEGLICPECGREFTFEELGVTLKELEDRRLTCGRVARPILRSNRSR